MVICNLNCGRPHPLRIERIRTHEDSRGGPAQGAQPVLRPNLAGRARGAPFGALRAPRFERCLGSGDRSRSTRDPLRRTESGLRAACPKLEFSEETLRETTEKDSDPGRRGTQLTDALRRSRWGAGSKRRRHREGKLGIEGAIDSGRGPPVDAWVLGWSVLPLLSVAVTASEPTWVLVPTLEGPHCAARATLVARLELTPGLLTTRTASAGPALEARRTALGADLSASVRPSPDGFEVVIRGPGDSKRGSANTVSEALDRAWPEDRPPLPRAIATPNALAVRALCEGDAARAVEAAGPALGPLLLHLMPRFPGVRRRGSVFERWGHGLHQLAEGRSEAAARELAAVVRALEEGEWGPVWRRPPSTSSVAPSALYLGGDAVYAFANESLIRLDIRTGTQGWRSHVGRVEPRPILGGQDPLLMVGDRGFVGLVASSGRALFHLDVPGAHPEVARAGEDVIAAGDDLLIRFSPQTGEVRWTAGLNRRVIAGPARAGDLLLLPLQVEIRVFDLEGKPVRTILMTDRLSSPVAPTANGFAWVLSGSDEALQVDPRAGRVRFRQPNLPGAAWPPVVLGERLALLTEARRSQVHLLDASAARVSRALPGRGPLALRADFRGILHLDRSGRTLIGRDASFSRNVRVALPKSARAIAVDGHRAMLGLEDRILVVDAEANRSGQALVVEAPVLEIVTGSAGGAALLANGTILGWLEPDPPESRTWRRLARHHAARAALRGRRPKTAETLARAALAREPSDWPARFLLAAALREQRSDGALAATLELLREVPARSPEGQRLAAIMDRGGIEVTPGLRPPASGAGALGFAASTSTVGPQGSEGLRIGFIPVRKQAFGETTIWMSERRIAAEREGSIQWRYRLPPGDALLRLEAGDASTLLAWSRRGLQRLGLENGRRGARIAFPRPPRFGCTQGNWAVTWDGQHLRSFGLDPPRAVGRASLEPVSGLMVAPDARGAVVAGPDGIAILIRGGANLSIRSPSRRRGG